MCYPSRGQPERFTHHSQEPRVIPLFSTFRIAILSSFVFDEHEVSGGALLASHLKIRIEDKNWNSKQSVVC